MTESRESKSSSEIPKNLTRNIPRSHHSKYPESSLNEPIHDIQNQSSNVNNRKSLEPKKNLGQIKIGEDQDLSMIPFTQKEDNYNYINLIVSRNQLSLSSNYIKKQKSNSEMLADYLNLHTRPKNIDLSASYSLKSISMFFNDILIQNHSEDNIFERKIGFLELLKNCFLRRKNVKILNHEVESNLVKLFNYCKKDFGIMPELSLLYGLNLTVFGNDELLISKDFCEKLGCFQFDDPNYIPCQELFTDFAIGVVLHQYYLITENRDLMEKFYYKNRNFQNSQILMRKCFKLLKNSKLQVMFSNVQDVKSDQPYRIFFDFFTKVLKKFFEIAHVKSERKRIKITIKESLIELETSLRNESLQELIN